MQHRPVSPHGPLILLQDKLPDLTTEVARRASGVGLGKLVWLLALAMLLALVVVLGCFGSRSRNVPPD